MRMLLFVENYWCNGQSSGNNNIVSLSRVMRKLVPPPLLSDFAQALPNYNSMRRYNEAKRITTTREREEASLCEDGHTLLGESRNWKFLHLFCLYNNNCYTYIGPNHTRRSRLDKKKKKRNIYDTKTSVCWNFSPFRKDSFFILRPPCFTFLLRFFSLSLSWTRIFSRFFVICRD